MLADANGLYYDLEARIVRATEESVMTTDIFLKRERALEDGFFRQVDKELLQRMKRKSELARDQNELVWATGITDESVLAELIELGIHSNTVLALWTFPLVWVAWSDGQIDQQQRAGILTTASELGHHKATASYELIESWLDFKPDSKLKKAWKDYMAFVCESVSEETRQAIQRDTTRRCRQLADSASFRYGFDIVERAQDAVIREIEQCFAEVNSITHVDGKE